RRNPIRSAALTQATGETASWAVAEPRRARLVTMADRIVITGAGGQVGRFLVAEATRRGHEVLALTSADWDITKPDAPPTLDAGDVVVNCAAFTAVDAAETDAERAYAVNADGARNVASACARAG